jgi:hypothetical protein
MLRAAGGRLRSQGLTDAAGVPVAVSFTPHLMCMSRGMESDIYVKLAPGVTADDLRAALSARYAEETFIKVLPKVRRGVLLRRETDRRVCNGMPSCTSRTDLPCWPRAARGCEACSRRMQTHSRLMGCTASANRPVRTLHRRTDQRR